MKEILPTEKEMLLIVLEFHGQIICKIHIFAFHWQLPVLKCKQTFRDSVEEYPILFTYLFNFNHVCADYASFYQLAKLLQYFEEQNYQRDCWVLSQQKLVKKGSFIPHSQQVVHKRQQNFSSKTKCHLKMRVCTFAYFYEMLCLKINWNLDRAPLMDSLISFHRSSHPGMFCKWVVLRNFVKFTGKHLCQSLFFNKVVGPGLQLS